MEYSSRVIVLIPIYNDWVAASRVVGQVERALVAEGSRPSFLLVDDGSSTSVPGDLLPGPESGTSDIEVLSLKRNLGHQRAIGVGLAWIEKHRPCHAVVIMDGDGEDDPTDVPRLMGQWHESGRRTIVFAARTRRSEGAVFRVSYVAFRVVHRILTGLPVRVGNFSVIPYDRLRALITVPDLWSHYAAAVFVSRLPFTTVPTVRAKRLTGISSMNFPALVSHGVSAIAVFSEVVSVRVLLAMLGCVAIAAVGIMAVIAIRAFTDLAIPGWATFTTGLLLMLLLQSIMFALLFSFTVLGNRKSASLILARDFELFVDGVSAVSVSSHRPPGRSAAS
jgi:hypothetical protein